MQTLKRLAWVTGAVFVVLAGSRTFAVDSTGLDGYQDQLRREIADRARQLRDARDGVVTGTNSWSTRSGTSTTDRTGRQGQGTATTWNLADPFGPPVDVGSQVWATPSSAQSGRAGGTAASNQTLDLSGRPMPSLQLTRTPAAAPPKAPAGDTAKRDATQTGGKDATAQLMASAQLLFDNGEFGAARQMLVPVSSSVRRPPEEVDAAKKFIDTIDTAGMKRLTEADEARASGDVDRAAALYDEIVRQFGAAPAATLARNRLAVLKADPEVAARFLLDKATQYVDRKRPDIALPLLREIALRYSATKAAAGAIELLKKMGQDQAGALTPDEELAARKWLIIGDIHALNGRPDDAVRSYRQVIQEFEDSKYAEIARDKIAAIGK